ncbi:MAG: DedA family protein [Gemmataceae bacterium]|nr:DedA family protein [Gemmataceae bacterium]
MTTEALYWYGSIFLWLFLTGIGIPPVPEEAGILYAAGVYALHPETWWPLAWAACGVGIVSADCVLYGVGRKFGPRLFEYRWVQKVLSTERRQRLEGRFHSHGMKLLVMARFLPPLRTGIFLIAGAARYSFVKFLTADLVYAVVGVGALFFGGSLVLDLVHRVGYRAIWFAVVPLVGYGLYRYYRYLKKREAGAAPPVSVLQDPAGGVPSGQPATDPAGAAAAMREAKTALQD